MNAPTLGVAVPSYEQPRYVGEAIASLRRLEVPFRAIVQDGGSSDATLSALQGAIAGDPRFELVVETDNGQADAINRAWARLIEGHELLTWVNTDDVVYPDGVAALTRLLATNPDVVAAYGDLDAIDEEGDVIGSSRAPNRVRRYRLVYHHNLVPGICTIIRTAAVRQVGMVDPDLHYAMDHDLFVRLASIGQLRRVPVKVAGYRTYPSAKTFADKAALEAEIASVRARYRHLPLPVAKFLRHGLRLAWWPTKHVYSRGVMRRRNRDFGVRPTPSS